MWELGLIIGNYNHSDVMSNFGRSQILTFERWRFLLDKGPAAAKKEASELRPCDSDG